MMSGSLATSRPFLAVWLALSFGLSAAPRVSAESTEIPVTVDTSDGIGPMPKLAACLSQADVFPLHTDPVRDRFRALGVRYVRQDHLLEAIVERVEDGTLVINWEPLDRRVDFIRSFGAEPIMCLSYMPGPLAATSEEGVIRPPKDYGLWEELVYRVVNRYNVERDYAIRYWEVWNEPNSGGFWRPVPPENPLDAYLHLYEVSARAVKRADPEALVGGPALAGGPVQDESYGNYAGEDFVRGLVRFCAERQLPLDFVSWHEYWWPARQYVMEADRIRGILREFPTVRPWELMITEWNYSWGHTEGHDSEVGATWVANTLAKAILPAGIDKACFFLGQDHHSDQRFRGYWGLMTHDGTPKAAYNVLRMFSMLVGERLRTNADESPWWKHDVGVLAARTGDGKAVSILLWRNGPGGEDLLFTACWEGTIRAPADGEYKLRLDFDDGVRFWVDERKLLDDWAPGARQREVTVALTRGEHPLRLEYREGGGDARVKLRWEGPGIPDQVVSAEYLSSASEAGLRGSYFEGSAFDTLVMERIDPAVDFDWGTRSPFSDPRSTDEPLRVNLTLQPWPEAPFRVRRFLMDKNHSNAYRDRDQAELAVVEDRVRDATAPLVFPLVPYSVTLVEIRPDTRGN